MPDDPTHEIATPPAERLTICRADAHGWFVMHDETVVACFERASGLADWIESTLSPLDAPDRNAGPLPAVLDQQDTGRPRRSLWQVIAGGRR